MKVIKEIAGRIFALWAMLLFVISLLIVVIPIWSMNVYDEPKRSKKSFGFYRAWMVFFFSLAGVRRRITGKEHFKKGEAYIVICNHRSLLDPAISVPAIPGAHKTIAKVEMKRVPVFGIVYKSGSVLVDRKSEESRRKSYVQMKEVLEMGLHMCLYPEGTRNKTSEPLQRFHDGAFKLAVETGKSIIPSLIFNTDKVLPRKTFFFWPHKVRMHFLPAVDPANKTSKQLREEVFEMMVSYYIQHQ